MKIFDHIIKTTEIIGISPLYAQPTKDAVTYQLYKAFKYVFFIHVHKQSIEISSNMFYPSDTADLDKASQTGKAIVDWKDQYYSIRSKIELLTDTTLDQKTETNAL